MLASITEHGRKRHEEGMQAVLAVQTRILRRFTRSETVRLHKQLSQAVETLDATAAFREEV